MAVYTPTTLLYYPSGPTANGFKDLVYLFHPSELGAPSLHGINITSKLDAAVFSESWLTLSKNLPFFNDVNATSAFTASIADDGTLYVFAGDCAAYSSELWTFKMGSNSESKTWEQIDTLNLTGPYLLGSSVAFSTTLNPNMSPPAVYSWGGMCPSKNTTANTWQQAAVYTNDMTKISASDNDNTYSASVVSNNSPIAEAGFTLTGLLPINVNSSGVMTQQRNLVVLGGHTSTAFVNMSTAAVWSLPEESWGFVTVSNPLISDELTIRADENRQRSSFPTTVDPRSGHTTVLSEDGSTMVVYGGWVGDISQAAQPQLAILHVGAGYGGSDGWRWEIPDAQPKDGGIYGHGAVLLPGNVMMVYGGYNIAKSGNSKFKRQEGSLIQSSAQFFNLTSQSWSTEYTHPNYDPYGGINTENGEGHDTAAPERNDKAGLNKLGLGLGLGLGLAAFVIAVLFVYWCRRRWLRKQRFHRDETVRSLAQDHRQFLSDNDDYGMPMGEKEKGFFPWSTNLDSWYTGGGDAYSGAQRSLGYETIRGTRNLDHKWGWESRSEPFLPNKTHRPAKLRAARGLYNPVSNNGEFAMAGGRGGGLINGSSPIHPIYEADEDMEDKVNRKEMESKASSLSLATPSTPGHPRPDNDPFATPPQAPTNLKMEANKRDPDVQDWVVDLDVADQLLNRMASKRSRTSPKRRSSVKSRIQDEDNRTDSNLSDRSAITAGSVSSRFRMFGLGASLSNKGKSPEAEEPRVDSSTSSDKSFSTARSSFPTLQFEGPALLFGSKEHPQMTKATQAVIVGESGEEEEFMPGSPSKIKSRPGWLGSLRRVFSGSNAQGNSTGQPRASGFAATATSYRQKSTSGSDYEAPPLVGLNPALLRRKQGKLAWKESDSGLEYFPVPGESSARDDSDWDIEREVEQRLVQVMFTVPRERLRVVNPEIEREEEVVLVNPSPDENEGGDPFNGTTLEGYQPGRPLSALPEVESINEGGSKCGDDGQRKARSVTAGKIFKDSLWQPGEASHKNSSDERKTSASGVEHEYNRPPDVDVTVSNPNISVHVEVVGPSHAPAPEDESDQSASIASSSDSFQDAREQDTEQSRPSGHILSSIHSRTPLSSTLAPSSITGHSQFVPSPVSRASSPAASQPPSTPMLLARDLDRAGFLAWEREARASGQLQIPEPSEADPHGLMVPSHIHMDDASSEITDYTVSTGGGARVAEAVWFERVQRLDQRERERGREAEEARVERVRQEAERVSKERERMLELAGALLGPLSPDSRPVVSSPSQAPGTPEEIAPRRRQTRVLDMVSSIESLRHSTEQARMNRSVSPTKSSRT